MLKEGNFMDFIKITQTVAVSIIETLSQLGVIVEKVIGTPLSDSIVHI